MTINDGADPGPSYPMPIWRSAPCPASSWAAGMFALSDVVFATIVSIKLVGLTAIAAGCFEIIQLHRKRKRS
jgi:hypothetical protein